MTSSNRTGRAPRADSKRTTQTILRAAQQSLSVNPAATMEDISRAAGVARTTIHRHFATREALVEAMSVSAVQQLDEAVAAAHSDSTPPLVVLYQVTARVLDIKIGWDYALSMTTGNADVRRTWESINTRCRDLLRRARDAGVIRADADLEWARRVYYALLSTSLSDSTSDTDVLSARIVDTLLRGVGTGASL